MASPFLNRKKSSPEKSERSAAANRPKRTLKPSRQVCIALAGMIGAGFVGGAGLFVWQRGEQAEMQKQVAAKQEQVASGERIARRLLTTETAYTDTQSQLRNLETSVTAGEYVPTLLRQMEALAKGVNLQVGSVRPKLEPAPAPPADKEARKNFVPWPYDKIHVDMEVRGSYWNVARLLYQLTEFPKILAVESVQVQTGPGGADKPAAGQSPELNVSLKLTGFIFPNDGAAPPDAVKAASLASALPHVAPPPIVGAVGAHARQPDRVVEPAATGATAAPEKGI